MNAGVVSHALEGGALILAGAGIFFDVVALLGADRLLKSRKELVFPLSDAPEILMVKPVRGLDHGARENFLSFLDQTYPASKILFAVDSEEDPALPLIRDIVSGHPEKVSVVVVTERTGRNRKMNKVASVTRNLRAPFILLNDSDIRVGPAYLSEIMAPMQEDRTVGAVTCLQRGTPAGGFSSRLAALLLNSETVPQGLVASVLAPLTYLYGPTMLFREEALRAIGGFDPMKDFLADDYHLGRLIAEKGYRIVLSPTLVDAQIRDEPLGDLLSHEVRWARTFSSLRPVGYGLSIIARPFVFCLTGFLAGGLTGEWGIASIAWSLYLVHLVLLGHLLNQFLERPLSHRDIGLWIAREWVSLFSYLASFGRTVKWRGYRYRILSGGALRPLDSSFTETSGRTQP